MLFLVILLFSVFTLVLMFLAFGLKKKKPLTPHCGQCADYELHHGNVISQTEKIVSIAAEE